MVAGGGGVVVVVNVGGKDGESVEAEGVGEVGGDSEGGIEAEGVDAIGSDVAVDGGDARQVGTVEGVANLSASQGVVTEVLDDHLGIDGLTIAAGVGEGDGDDAGIFLTAGTDHAEIVDGATFTEGGVVVGTLGGGVDEAELEHLGEVAGDE